MELFVAVVVSLVVACHGLPTDVVATGTPCICTMDYRPVCGVNGKTYSNKCAMDCEGVQLLYSGECKPVCACPRIYKPVCGQDGKTYSNQCEMNCAGVAFFQDGACTVTPSGGMQKRADNVCPCFMIYLPVCGSDGITYGNKCALDCNKGVTMVKDGPCDGTLTNGI